MMTSHAVETGRRSPRRGRAADDHHDQDRDDQARHVVPTLIVPHRSTRRRLSGQVMNPGAEHRASIFTFLDMSAHFVTLPT